MWQWRDRHDVNGFSGGAISRRRFAMTRMGTRALLLLALACASPCSWAQRPPLVVPRDADAVLERLPRGYAKLEPGIASDPVTLTQVNRLLAVAAASGDARLAARAERLIARLPAAQAGPGVQMARAYAAQYRHDFPAALRLLDGIIATDPRDGDARLTRAQVQLVRGRIDRARSDCAALTVGVDTSLGLVCLSALSLRIGNLDTAAKLADRWLSAAGGDDPMRRHMLVIRAEAAARVGNDRADQLFGQALRASPHDVRTLAAYARYLRSMGRDRQVLALLSNAPDNDGLHLQRALAAHAARTPETRMLAGVQARRYRLARDLGSEPELRDEAEFWLTVRGDYARALQLALRNFKTQRDYEDVDLLRRAALAAKRPQALLALQHWEKSQGLPSHVDDGESK